MPKPFTIAVYNPISGSGSTTIVANLFALLVHQQTQRDVSLIDADLFYPSLHYYFPQGDSSAIPLHVQIPHIDRGKCILCNVCAKSCHFNAIRIQRNVGFIQFDENNCISCGACFNTCRYGAISLMSHKPGQIIRRKLSKQASLIHASSMVPERYAIPMIWQMKQQAMHSELCLIDVKAGRSAETREALFEADLLLIVIDPFSFTEGYGDVVLPKLVSMARQSAFVVNRAHGMLMRHHAFASHFGIPVLAELPYDENMHWWSMEAKPAIHHSPVWMQHFTDLLSHIHLYRRTL